MNDTKPTISSKDERLMFIEFSLLYKGEVSRSDITEMFEITAPSATRDIIEYNKRTNDQNCTFDKHLKSHVIKDETFSPLFIMSDCEILNLIKKTIAKDNEPISYRFKRINLPKWDELTSLTRAINKRLSVKINYLSMNNGESEREIYPHSIFDDGLRTYVRALDKKDYKFKNFSLSRITKSESTDHAAGTLEQKEADKDWTTKVMLTLIPHPSIKRKEIIEFEYRMVRGELNVEIRSACVGFFLQSWNVDCSNDYSLSSRSHQLALKNRNQIKEIDSFKLAPQ